ncbi:MAG: 30S ribosomal protein S13 [Nanoarchaeota archaeon]
MENPKQEIKHIVRVADTDIQGHKSLFMGLRKIKGINFMFSNLVCHLSGVDPDKKIGILSDEDIKKVEAVIKDPIKAGAPLWMINRRKDFEDGQMKHLISSDLTFTQDNDIKLLRKIKTYRGVRHSSGLPVRGQRTKSNFRKNKGKLALGVKKKAGKSGKA